MSGPAVISTLAWVIDDEPFANKLLQNQLFSAGLTQVRGITKPTEAIHILKEDPASCGLIFLDLQMPEMDGIQFIRALSNTGYAGRLVLISGHDERVMLAACKVAEFHQLPSPDILAKPASPEKLQAILQRVAGTSSIGQASGSVSVDELRRAIAQDELVNYYEPKVAIADGRMIGVETLVRWQPPGGALVAPGQFIALAEKHGLIDELTRGVLRRALKQARVWQQEGWKLQLSVNVSLNSLSSLEYPEFIAAEADEIGVATHDLTLEITESQVMRNPELALDIMARLRLKGVGLSIDDFGTGHSSLTQLRDVPFDELKIDRGFVREAWSHQTRRAIVEASIELARKLNMKSVAEGVEDQADWDFVKQAGCDVAQGYFMALAMPASELPQWRREWEARLPNILN